ncbi:MAG: hypothetical protein IIB35_05070 [Gemmatimonadetes bacterium]|nr:hypothetical protein [Gemmatimonadota bacterium]
MKRTLTTGLLLLACAACEFGSTPSESVDLLVEAVRSKDSVEVARFIDIRRVAESAVDPLLLAAALMSRVDPDRFRQQTGGMGIDVLEQFRPMIAPLMEQLFWQMMLDPESLQQGPLGMMLGNRELPFEDIASAYQGVLREEREGNKAIVAIELLDENSGRPPMVFQLRLERVEGDWQVVAFDNLSDAIAEVMGVPGF